MKTDQILSPLNSPHRESKQDQVPSGIFLLSSFHNFKLCVMLWKRTGLPASQSWYVTCYVKGGADIFSVRPCESGPLTHFYPCMILPTRGPVGSLGCGCELDLNSLIPSETTGISGSLPPACNETFGKNKGDANTKDTMIQKFCVFTQIMSVPLSWCVSWF